MKITATYLGKKHSIELKPGSPIKNLLEKMNINPVTVLVGKNGEIVPETDSVKKGDKIEIIRTISGG